VKNMEQSIKKLESKTFSFKIQKLDNDLSQIQENKSNAETDYITLFHRFVSNLQVIWRYGHEVGSLAEKSSLLKLAELPKVVKRIKEKQKNYSNKAIAEITFSIPDKTNSSVIEKRLHIYDSEDLSEILKIYKSHKLALRLLNESLLQQIVNAWELLLGDILSWNLKQNPDSISKDKSIPYSDLMFFSSFDEVQQYLIEKEVSAFLRNKSTKEQIKYLKDLFNIEFQSQFKLFNELLEIVLRRHLVVHAGSVVNAEYCKKLKNIKPLQSTLPEIGTSITIDAKYIKSSWEVIFSAGVILTHMIGKSIYYKNHDKETRIIPDSLLINTSVESIGNQQYAAAISILDYANKLTLSNKELDMIVLVNLAQSHRWRGKKDECSRLLDKEDWNMYSSNFKLCVSVLREDLNAFKKSLKISYNEGTIGLIDLINWPIFQSIKQNQEFCDAINEVFGEEIKFSNICDKDALFKLDPSITITSVLESMINELSD
jgi:hypothetical protein